MADGLKLDNCHSNCKIISSLSSTVKKNMIGLLVGSGTRISDEVKCLVETCSCLKYGNYTQVGEFDGNWEDIVVQDGEEEMPDILEVLGASFKQGSRDYPILSWQ